MAKLNENDIRLIGRGAGVIQGITEKVIREGRKLGLMFADFHRLATPEGDETLEQMLGIMVAAQQASKIVCSNARIERKITLTLDRRQSPRELLEATKCDYIYEWMKTHCPEWKGPHTEVVTVALIDMGEDFTRDDSLAVIPRLGLNLAQDNAALWTLSKEHPDLQRNTWVIDPGTVWLDEGGDRCIAYLSGSSDFRNACLRRVALWWYRNYRVLALC